MSQWLRFGYGMFGTLAIAVGAIMWWRIGKPLLVPLATEEHAGPFSYIVDWMDPLIPMLLAVLLLVLWAWVFVGSVQKERKLHQTGRI